MLKIEGQKATIANLNIRPETHGQKIKIACDMKLLFKQASGSLNALAEHLQHVFYWDKKQPDLLTPEHCPNLREANLLQQKWGREYSGYRFFMPYGIDGADESTIAVEGCKFNEIKFTPEEGGTVAYEARLQFYTDAATRGLLSEFIGSERDVNVIPPEVEPEAEQPAKGKRKGGKGQPEPDPDQGKLEVTEAGAE
jgi:hypothetical protein